MELSDIDFKRFSSLIYESCGINLNDNKKELVTARLSKILRKRGIDSFKKYYRLILEDKTGQEIVHFMDAIATNQTFFFRENDHFVMLREKIIPELMEQKSKSGNKTINIWSSACSSGEEPYSIAIILRECCNATPYNFRILATDISTKVLKIAIPGVYPIAKLKDVPKFIIRKYFQYGTGNWQHHLRIKKEIRDLVSFNRYNLIKDQPLNMSFDVIFCRNVMIYFDASTQETLVSKLYNNLSPKGYLLIGHSESLSSIKHNFKYVKPTIYRKE